MIEESRMYKNRVKVFTSMVGKKKSLIPLKKNLENMEGIMYAAHSIFQGKTQRWILLWSFDSSMMLRIKPDSEVPAKKRKYC